MSLEAILKVEGAVGNANSENIIDTASCSKFMSEIKPMTKQQQADKKFSRIKLLLHRY